MLSSEQVAEMVRLRVEERLTQCEIAKRLGVRVYDVSRKWKNVPRRYRSRFYVRMIEDGKCPECRFYFEAGNPRDAESGLCALCVLQRQGQVVLYDG